VNHPEFTINRTMGMVTWKVFGELPLSANFPRGAFKILRDSRFEERVTVVMPRMGFYYREGTGHSERLYQDDLEALRKVLLLASKRPTFGTTKKALREAANVCTKMLGLSAVDLLAKLGE
jgi:hypothetical protein